MQPFSYFGGKYHLRERLYSFFPDHVHFVDVFGGSGAVLLGKRESELETFNDVDSAIVGFFRLLQNKEQFEELKNRLNVMCNSRELFYEYRETWDTFDCPVEKYVRWYTLAICCFGGVLSKGKHQWSFSVVPSPRKKVFERVLDLEHLVVRLRDVQLENRSFQKILKLYDAPETFFYLDPPYILKTRKSGVYDCEMTNKEHQQLVDFLLKIKGKAMLSGYKHKIYEVLEESGWYTHDFKMFSGVNSKKGKTERVDTIWMNYEENVQITLL